MFEINEEKCIHCGLCIKDCSANAIKFDENKIPVMDESKCFKCQHCMAICPVGALSICNKNPENSDKILEQNPDNILNLIKSRRSFRHYKQENVSPEKMQKLKDMLKFVPTGCNNHRLYFSFVDDIEVMNDFRSHVNGKILEALTQNPENPLAEKFSGYTRRFVAGEDIIFRTAPHLLVVSTPLDAPCYEIDPTIALSYFELYAQSMGLGTCWCGLGQYCLMTMPELSEYLKVPTGYKASYMMLFGEPENKYARTVQPEEVEIISA
jgi:Fe-S-cluster-containing hydrogenase component 2